jgi:PAS domain S-box-containing protein
MPSRTFRRRLSAIAVVAAIEAGVCATVLAQSTGSGRLGQPDAWQLYKPAIVGAILALLVLQARLFAALLGQRSRRRQSDGRYAAVVRAVPDLMFLQTMDGVYLDCHAADPSQFLLPPDQFLGKNMRDVLPPALLREFLPAFGRVADATEPVVVEYDLDLSGKRRRFEARLVRCNNDQVLTMVRDITELAEATAALRESVQRYQLASTAGSVGVWDWHFDTNELYVDPGLKALLGFKDEEITSRPEDWGSRVHPDDLPVSSASVQACIDGETDVYEVAHRMLHKDGSTRWFLSRGSAIRGADGALRRLVGTKVDITERKRASDQVRLALEATTTGMLMVSRAGRIVMVNAHVEGLFGYQREELIGALVDRLLPERARDANPETRGFRWDGTFSTIEPRELDGVRKDGTTIPLEVGFSPLHSPEGEFVLCTVTDNTERRQAERERDDLTRQLRDLAGRLIAAQEMERTRIARDLHDDISQQLAALSIALSGLRRHAAALSGGANVEAEIVVLQQRTTRLAESVRELSHELHPDAIRHSGLTASLAAYCEGISQPPAFSVTCHAEGNVDAIDQAVVTSLYRIAQEALHNVVKHANARHAKVRLVRTGDSAELTVSDDGSGFDVQIRKTGTGLGLVSITERVRMIGGTLSIVTAANKGTQLRVHVPIAVHAPADATDPFAGSAALA